jgi:hypothetical protein
MWAFLTSKIGIYVVGAATFALTVFIVLLRLESLSKRAATAEAEAKKTKGMIAVANDIIAARNALRVKQEEARRKLLADKQKVDNYFEEDRW